MTIALKTKRFFESPEGACREISTLHRVVDLECKLKTVCPKTKFSELHKYILLFAETVLQRNPLPDNKISFSKPALSKIDSFLLKFFTSSSTEPLEKQRRRLLKDLTSIYPTSPLKKTHAGLEGPTFLSLYDRATGHFEMTTPPYATRTSKCVIKFIDEQKLEPICNYVYRSFFNCLPSAGNPAAFMGFLVPRHALLDFSAHSYETSNDTNQPIYHHIPDDICTYMRQQLLELAKSQITPSTFADFPNLTSEHTCVMLSERISGENLFDFIRSKYKDLSLEQKQKLFEYIGRIILLDLILGNNDRFIKIDFSQDVYGLEMPLEANLGNLMVVLPREETHIYPIPYAIDNGVNPVLVFSENGEDVKYQTFLQKLFSSANFATDIANAAITCIQAKLDCAADDTGEDQAKLESELFAFRQDLQNLDLALSSILHGIEQMITQMHEVIIPRWEASEDLPLKVYLREKSPALLILINKNLIIFKHTRQLL